MDETWFHHFTSDMKEQKQWTKWQKFVSEKVKTVPSAVKVIVPVYGMCGGKMCVLFKQKQQYMNIMQSYCSI